MVFFFILTTDSDLIPPSKRQKYMSLEDRWKEGLCSSYLKLSIEVWPPIRSVPFVQLALVQPHKEARHIGLQTVNGKIDEILGQKVKITLDDALAKIEHGSLVLLEGRPGCGKTTLMVKISCEWAKGNIFLGKLVLLVQLRQLAGNGNISLRDLISVACGAFSPADIDALSSFIKKGFGEDVVFIFDGFDEYAPGGNEDNFIFKVAEKKLLYKSTVVVSSRPVATRQFRRSATMWIEVVGFRDEQIIEFIHSYFNENIDKASKLVKHLEEHPNLMTLCYLPLHCSMFVYFHEEGGCTSLPTTETAFFKNFTLSILYRSFKKRNLLKTIPLELTFFNDLPPTQQSLFYNICQLAFHATIKSQQVFEASELNALGISFNTSRGDLDLLVIDSYFVMSGVRESYTFLHLTLQEYLAAVYIATLSDSKKKDVINNHSDDKHLSVMWYFLCGMLDYSMPMSVDLFKLILHTSDDITFRIQCAYESQYPLMCAYIFKLYSNRFIFSRVCHIDFTPFIYVVKNSGLPDTIKLQFSNCTFSKQNAVALFQGVSDHQLSLEVV